MKTTNKFLALALMAVAMVFASCSKDDDNDPVVPTQQEIETKIIGKWKLDTKEGEKYLTNNKVVLTFNNMHQCLNSFARKVKPFDGYFWINKKKRSLSSR